MWRAAYLSAMRLAGRNVDIPKTIPTALLFSELMRRIGWGLRGIIRFRKLVFIGPNVKVRGKSFLKLGKYATIETGCYINAYSIDGVSIGERTKVGAHTVLGATNHMSRLGKGIEIGPDCGIGEFSFIGAMGGVRIGRNVIMGQYVSFHASNHVFSDPNLPIRAQGTLAKGIVVEDDVWIGAKATLLDGSRVGTRSVVAAGAVVNAVFRGSAILGGVPAHILKTI